ncbi:hypothetical protein PESP_a1276 [Pseudoalteromonas espejiana DSM 9414]|uniref:histidine kinase n=1 Tax=Pseudoalteromonas espejiana TaxID=28107 RepID=A0A510XZ33_9GAMM|nr:PAS domain-containing hybrid sensor histidine kinase/response regulator [Pseudoalteromonas espejiana]ASM49415.1 hypothetical protein PESP_a1276 [Pseudoalteromonas espejiana DSM 9414]GEK56209.1 hypothetical protein PES01_30540 [Pseudoalteromonas espejiana]
MEEKDELQVQVHYALIEQLSANTRRQSKLLALLDECVFECDKNLAFSYVNEAWQSKLGFTSPMLIGKKITSLLTKQDALKLSAYTCSVLDGESNTSLELKINNSDGLANWFELRLACDDNGGFIGSLHDIQRHKDFQYLLTQQQEYAKRLSLVASHTNNLVIITDQFGKIEWVNKSFETLTSYRCEEVIGLSPGKLLQGPKTNLASRQLMSKAVKNGQPFQIETVNYDKYNNEYWVAIDATPVKDENDKVRHFIAIETNITQRVKAEQAMAEIEYNYHSVVDNIPEIVLRLDEQGKLLFMNKAWQDFFQIDIAKNIGLPIDDFIVTEDAQQVRDVLNRYQNGHRGIERFDVRFTKTTGEENWVEMTLTPIKSYNDDSLTSIAATVVDIQERVVAEQILLDAKHQAETLAESKSRFMANISHEIRTPLNAVIGCADILHDTGLTTEQKRYTQMIKTSSDALLSILDDVLTYSRFEAQAISIDNQPFSLDTCLEEAIDIVSESAVQKGLELIFDFYPDVPAQVVGDHVRIRQIAINLLSNAIKFTQTGSLIIKAKCIEFDNNNFTLQLSIKDTGIGIAKNKLDSMFKPFIQSDNSITREHGGSGLGLAICKQICDAAGGSISVSSELNKGSEFIVNYPLSIDTTDSVQREGFSARSKKPQVWIFSGYSILNQAIEHMLTRHSIGFTGFSDINALPKNIITPDAIVVTNKDDLLTAEHFLKSYDCLNKPCLLFIDLLGKTQKAAVPSDGMLRVNGPFKPSHLPRAISILDEQLFHLDIIFTNKKDTAINGQKKVNQPFKGTYVLVVEDNKNNQIVVKQLLEQQGCSVEIANNGQEALEKVQYQTVDLIFMDIQMPILDGISATKKIRELSIVTPIIALTANAIHGDKERFIEAGMNDYLAKPIIGNKLNALLDKHLPKLSNLKHTKLERMSEIWTLLK